MNALGGVALTLDILEDWAGPEIFDRGESLTGDVSIKMEQPGRVEAVVAGSRLYSVSFRSSGSSLEGYCSCPYFDRGHFCKHLVALGLVILGEADVPEVLSFDDVELDAVSTYLESLNHQELIALVEQARREIPPFDDYLQRRATAVGGTDTEVEAHIKDLITDACRVGSFVDYRRSGEVANQLDDVVEAIAAYVTNGREKALVKQSRRLVDRISKIMERADDSNGSIGDVLSHASFLHTHICVNAHADPKKLVEWILKTQLEGPGWPDIDIADFWEILDDQSKEKYRRVLEKALSERTGHYSTWTARFHLIEYADAAGDTDLAVQLHLGEGNMRKAYYRLSKVGRMKEADQLFEQMLGTWKGLPGHRLDAGEIVEKLLSMDRGDEALSFTREELQRRQTLENYKLLVKVGEHSGQDLRAEARETVKPGWETQKILIHEDDADALWEHLRQEPSHMVTDLAISYFEKKNTDKALELLLRLGADTAGGPATKSTYNSAAAIFARAKKLEPGSPEVEQAIAEVRETHARRTTMIKIFDRKGLR